MKKSAIFYTNTNTQKNTQMAAFEYELVEEYAGAIPLKHHSTTFFMIAPHPKSPAIFPAFIISRPAAGSAQTMKKVM